MVFLFDRKWKGSGGHSKQMESRNQLRKRILITCFALQDFNEGDFLRALAHYQGLQSESETSLICMSLARASKDYVVAKKVLPGGSLNRMLLWLPQLFMACVGRTFDVILCSGDYYGFFICYVLSKVKGQTIVYDAGGVNWTNLESISQRDTLKALTARTIEKLIGMHADAVLTATRQTERFYSQLNSRTFLIPNSLRFEDFVASTEKRKYWRDFYGISPNENLVGCIGPFGLYNGKPHNMNWPNLKFIQDNLDKISESTHLMAVGACPQDLRKWSNRIIYSGYVQDYVGHLSALDAVIQPAIIPTSGTFFKMLTSMALSLPIFTTPNGIVGLDMVADGENLLVFPLGKLLEGLAEAFSDKERLVRIGKKAREYVEKHHNETINRKILLAALHLG